MENVEIGESHVYWYPKGTGENKTAQLARQFIADNYPNWGFAVNEAWFSQGYNDGGNEEIFRTNTESQPSNTLKLLSGVTMRYRPSNKAGQRYTPSRIYLYRKDKTKLICTKTVDYYYCSTCKKRK